MKAISVRQMATIKRVAQNVNPLVVKKNKIIAKISQLEAEYQDILSEIEGHEMGIMALTGGYTSENLVTKRVEDTGKVDKDGKSIKITKYEPREDVVEFNKETNMFYIKEFTNDTPNTKSSLEDIENVENVENTEDSDFSIQE